MTDRLALSTGSSRTGGTYSTQPLPEASGLHPEVVVTACGPSSSLADSRIAAHLARIRPILMRDAFAVTTRHRERLLPMPDAAEQIREIFKLLCHHVNDIALALHATTTSKHAG